MIRGRSLYIVGRELHASLFDYEPVIIYSLAHGMLDTLFDQCMANAVGESQKTTVLRASPRLHVYVEALFGPLVCNHSTHAKTLLGLTPDEVDQSCRAYIH